MIKTHAKTARQIGRYSRPHGLAKLDGRTREAALMRDTRARLIAHVGGSPSAVELALIERAAQLTLKVAQLDAKLDANAMSDHDHRHYLAWSNSLTRTLEKLGMKGAAERTRPRSPGEGARLRQPASPVAYRASSTGRAARWPHRVDAGLQSTSTRSTEAT